MSGKVVRDRLTKAEMRARPEVRREWLARHRLRPVGWTGRNLLALARRGGGERAVDLLRRYRSGGGCSTPYDVAGRLHFFVLDHSELYGRMGQPSVAIGHPYELPEEDLALLRGLEASGLDVHVSRSASWYGWWTYHVRFSVRGILPPLSPAEAFDTRMILGACPQGGEE